MPVATPDGRTTLDAVTLGNPPSHGADPLERTRRTGSNLVLDEPTLASRAHSRQICSAVHRALLWSLRAAWAALPLLAGPSFATALHDTSRPVQLTAAVGLWAGWAAGLLLTLVPTPASLTLLRTLAPAVPIATAVAFVREPGLGAGVALAGASFAAVLAFTAEVGQQFVQGGAYGDERRFLLRPPGALVLGPLEILWLATVGGLAVGALLLAAGAWLPGGLLVALGAVLAIPVIRRFHGLSRRWLVLVPAGVVLHDHLLLVETALVRRQQLRSAALALADSEAADLTGGALGVAVELRFVEPQTLIVAGSSRSRTGTAIHAVAVLVSPTRPGAALAALSAQAAIPPPRTI
jgi:hypothetical protein